MLSTLGLGALVTLAQQDLPTPRDKTQFNFSRYLEGIAPDYQSSEVSKGLNYEGAVSITAIPTIAVPASDIRDLELGKTIGALLLPSGSNKLLLSAGFYSVSVLKSGNTWKVQFRDKTNAIRGEAPASVTEAKEEVSRPYVSLDHSVCHRFDKIIVCY